MKFINENTIRLCGRGKCCPDLHKEEDGTFTITDDYNGKVVIKQEEMEELLEAYKALKGE